MYAELWQWVTSEITEQFCFAPYAKKKTAFFGLVLKMRFFLQLHCAVNFFSAKQIEKVSTFFQN